MKVLIVGCYGQVGSELRRQAAGRGLAALALDRGELDITDAEAVAAQLAASGAGVVINAAAYTAVDRAEQEPALAYAANRDGPAHLAAACAQLEIPLLHISTDYVFDGQKSGPYREDDPPAPQGVYGDSKWQGEEAVRQRLDRHIILRVSWVFGIDGHNFVKTMLRLARERDELRVVADQHGCPTYAGAIAEVLLELAARIGQGVELPWGTYHYGGTPATTWHSFAEAILAEGSRYETLRARTVTAITTADYPTPARRPANSVLACERIAALLGIRPQPWQTGLQTMLAAGRTGEP